MTDLVLRTLPVKAVEPRNQRIPFYIQRVRQGVSGDLYQLLVRSIDAMRVASAAEERAEKGVIHGRAARPLRRDPRRGEQRAALDAWHDEARAFERMAYLVPPISKRHRRGGGVRNPVAEPGERRVECAQQGGRRVCRNGKDHRARVDARCAGTNDIETTA